MKVAILCVLACLIGLAMSQSCILPADCSSSSLNCGEGFEVHCLDNACQCLHESPVPCQDDDDCEAAHHNHEHCGAQNSREWKCSHHSRCYCVRDN